MKINVPETIFRRIKRVGRRLQTHSQTNLTEPDVEHFMTLTHYDRFDKSPLVYYTSHKVYIAITKLPFPSSKKSHFQNEAKCETFVVKMSFICIIIENHFHINGFALSLVLKVRFFGTRKWPIKLSVNHHIQNVY